MSDESIKEQLLDAIYSRNREEALHLLSLLSNPHKVKYSDNFTILHWAAYHGVLDIVQVLINEYQFDTHCVDDDGYTPLHYAAYKGHLNIIKYLITECNCNPQSKNKYGVTPLDFANTSNHHGVIQYLESVITADRLLESSLTTAMKEGGGKMKPRNITMHGPPGAGKTSLKRVIIGLSPLPSEGQNSTDIIENAVRAVSTDRITADERRSVMLTEVDNEELIKMLARKVESHRVTSHQTQEPQHKPVSTVCVCVCVCVFSYVNLPSTCVVIVIIFITYFDINIHVVNVHVFYNYRCNLSFSYYSTSYRIVKED